MYFYNPIGVSAAFICALIGLLFVVTGVVTLNVVGLIVGPAWCYAAYALLRNSIDQ